MYRRFRRLHRIMLVVDGRRRTGQIVDFIDFDEQWERHIVPHELEAWVAMEVVEVAFRAGKQIVGAKHLVPVGQ